MASILIRNLPQALHARLKKLAGQHHRSLNKEAIALIEQALTPSVSTSSPALRMSDGLSSTMEALRGPVATKGRTWADFFGCASSDPHLMEALHAVDESIAAARAADLATSKPGHVV